MAFPSAEQAPQGGRRFAVLEMDDQEKWKGYTLAGWQRTLDRPGDRWTLFQCWKGEWPAVAQLDEYDALVLAGSHYSAYQVRLCVGHAGSGPPGLQSPAVGHQVLQSGCLAGCTAVPKRQRDCLIILRPPFRIPAPAGPPLDQCAA